MTPSLAHWISDADSRRHYTALGMEEVPLSLSYLHERSDDYYFALVKKLFELLRGDNVEHADWAKVGLAFDQFADQTSSRDSEYSVADTRLFSSAAFYLGGFPASAMLVLRKLRQSPRHEVPLAVYELLSRPVELRSRMAQRLTAALQQGNQAELIELERMTVAWSSTALNSGPDDWVPAHLLSKLVERFNRTNIRAVLPDGFAPFWQPFIDSLMKPPTPSWEFFPSQITAIQAGVVHLPQTYSLQMPTGAGKTALCETILYWNAVTFPRAIGVVLVPFRSLAAELRRSLVAKLGGMGISARCIYGGTVPTADEMQGADTLQVVVATPEALAGFLGSTEDFLSRINLVICDEGHLLDTPGRGIGLELLLARLKVRPGGAPRFVFISAIVPNIHEINAWLGGSDETVIRSEYRPSIASFAVLRALGTGAATTVGLHIQPHMPQPPSYSINGFLTRRDFQWLNEATGRTRTFPFSSHKTRAIASARKALSMGAVAVFAANKRGEQGAIGLAEELIEQLRVPISLPQPAQHMDPTIIGPVSDYLVQEYGPGWIGTQTLIVGAILHHGDIPQETREVFESVLRRGAIRFAICTNTLAEGVNLPIRTLVLYSVRRMGAGGAAQDLLARDIKNLVGRAGRAGSTTQGLVICANAAQWTVIDPVARQAPGENVVGALRTLLERAAMHLAFQQEPLDNVQLEREKGYFPLIDGLDNTLIDLIGEEVGVERLAAIAQQIANETFMAQKANEHAKRVLADVIRLRSERVAELRGQGRLPWFRATGARVRMLSLVEQQLLPSRASWADAAGPLDPSIVDPILAWAWPQSEMQAAVRDAYRVDGQFTLDHLREPFFLFVRNWLSGKAYRELATASDLSMDDALGIHTRVVSFTLQTVVEQGMSLLEKLLADAPQPLSDNVKQFAEHLRFGAPSKAAVNLAQVGVRHRSAYARLGLVAEISEVAIFGRDAVAAAARSLLRHNGDAWRRELGQLVFEHTKADLGP